MAVAPITSCGGESGDPRGLGGVGPKIAKTTPCKVEWPTKKGRASRPIRISTCEAVQDVRTHRSLGGGRLRTACGRRYKFLGPTNPALPASFRNPVFGHRGE